MNGKMRGCRIVLPNACGWDICLRAKFRDILRYSVLQIPRCLSLPVPLYLDLQLPPGTYQCVQFTLSAMGYLLLVCECGCL